MAVVLSLISPGAGHFLMGAFRRGLLWAVSLTVVGLVALFTVRLGFWTMVPVLAAGVVARVVCAVDSAHATVHRPSWTLVLLAWAGLAAGGFLIDPIKDYYRAHHAQAFTIPSGSMQDTLLVGDYILVDKAVYRSRAPARGEIVVFAYPPDEKRTFIFRIVGVPGETLQLLGDRVLVDGTPLDEPYVRPGGAGGMCAYAYGCQPLVVPASAYFVMGDNRGNAQDSRYWGFVRRDKILGRAREVYWSWDSDRHWLRWRRLGHPIS